MTADAHESDDAASTVRSMRLAYLTTEYPRVSHTFIRREIIELERRGHSVLRLSVRDFGDAIADPSDFQERKRTTCLLSLSPCRLLWDALVVTLSRPIASCRAARKTWTMSRRSDRGLLRHVMYMVEAACVLRIVNHAQIEHLHVHFGTNAAAVARLAHTLGGPSYSFTVHGPDEFDAPIAFSVRDKTADAEAVVAITHFCSAQLKRWVAFEDWSKIHIVHCTTADEYFTAAEPIPSDSQTLICVGRLSAQKGHMVLLDAVHRLVSRGVRHKVILAGDGELRSEIEQRITELGLEDTVSITGWISEAEVRSYLRIARGLVLPSFAEGLPVVIMEAFALARPVIATRIAGVGELVRDGENGWLVTAGHVDELVEAMRGMLETPTDQLDERGRKGQVDVQRKHSVRTEGAKLEALFDRIIHHGRKD